MNRNEMNMMWSEDIPSFILNPFNDSIYICTQFCLHSFTHPYSHKPHRNANKFSYWYLQECEYEEDEDEEEEL